METVLLLGRACDLAWLAGNSNRPSAHTLATAIVNANRAARTLERMHLDECNGDHERCPACKGEGCSRCNRTGRVTDREIASFKSKRDKLEARVLRLLGDVHIRASIDRDPRSGPVRVYMDAHRMERDEPFIVLPMEAR